LGGSGGGGPGETGAIPSNLDANGVKGRMFRRYIFPCTATLPDITLAIEGYNAVVPGSYINYAPVSEGSSSCFGGIQSNTGVGQSIFGDIFLKAQFVVFSDAASGPQLGFAAKPL